MAVTEYKPINELGCRYSYDKLENVVYLVSKEHVKNVHVDNGEAYIDGLTETPIRLEGFSIDFTEESSLDERYKFTKTVKFSLHGYVSHKSFNSKYYVILKSKDGTKWMVNVDFPSKVTYTFNLNGNQYQTDFTFSSLSNFPTLKLATDIDEGVSPCKQLRSFGIESLKLLEKDYCTLDTSNGIVHTYGKSFVDVDFLGQTCSLQESFNGERISTTIDFSIGFDAYKSSWHYNLLEFLDNRYSAIITPKGGDAIFFSGFDFGLQPSFNIATTSQNGQSDIITVTLTETSLQGTVKKIEYHEQEDTDTRWVYIKNVGILKGWECVAVGVARYLLQQEVNAQGQPTGRYKCLEGYESQFSTLNIVGTFSEDYRFSNSECTEAVCQVNTNIPSSITYRSATCNTYSYSASCDWNVSGLASYMTVTPSSGNAGSAYTLSVCNTKTPTMNESSTFNITAGNNTKIVNVNLTTDASILNPERVDINCLPQTVAFSFNANCPITVTNIDSRLSYQLRNSVLSVYVPRNYSLTDYITWNITVKDCNNHTQTVQINQDKTYERWVTVEGYICSGTTSYTKQQRYTGTTSTNINTPTSEYRTGSVIQQNDTRCGSYTTRWTRNTSAYTCVDGDKWSIDEEEVSYDGTNWTKDGNTRLGEMVESASSFCEEEVEYEWRLTTNWQCYGTTDFNGKFMATYNDSRTYSAECDSNTILSSATTKPSGYDYTAMTSAVIGDCITSIGARSFEKCSGLTSVTIPYSVTNISSCAFSRNENLSAITIPNSVRTIYSNAFEYCVNLRSVTIPSGVTTIEYGTFADCHSLSSVTIPSGVTRIASYAFYYCTSLPSVTIPNGVTFIGRQAFDSCTSLTSITIPSSVTEIATQAFIGCNSLTSITVEATTPPTLGSGAFVFTNNCSIYVPCESIDAYKSATNWSEYANRFLGIPPCDYWNGKFRATYNDSSSYSATCDESLWISTATTKPSGYEYTAMTSAEVGDCILNIGNYAFSDCSGLTSVKIPNYLESIGYAAFLGCTSLTSCTIPSGVTRIQDFTFTECYSLSSVTIPSGVTEIGINAFRGTDLTAVTIPNGVTTIKGEAFGYCSNLSSITIPNTVQVLAYQNFWGCSNLTSCTFEQGSQLTAIENLTFSHCSSLPSITIPDSVTTIGGDAFAFCTSLSSVTIPNSVTEIGYTAFRFCISLSSVTIPSSVTEIDGGAFFNCSGLTSVIIPSGVTNIGDRAFYECRNLTSVTVNATTPPTLGEDAFYRTNNCPIYVPCSSVLAYKAASGWSSYASRIRGIAPCDDTLKFSATYSNGTSYSGECDSNSTLTTGNTHPNGYTYTAMTSAVIGYCITSIGTSAFTNCSSLSSVTIPDSVTSIGERAFNRCSGLTSVNIPSGVTAINNAAFAWCEGLTSITIPNSVQTMGYSVFSHCSGLTSVTIGTSLTKIGNYEFEYCESLQSITIYATTPPELGTEPFRGTSLTAIYVPSDRVNTYKSASGWSSYASIIQAIP